MNETPPVLTAKDIARLYPIGYKLAAKIAKQIGFRAGKKLLVRCEDLEAYLERAAQQQLDLWA